MSVDARYNTVLLGLGRIIHLERDGIVACSRISAADGVALPIAPSAIADEHRCADCYSIALLVAGNGEDQRRLRR